MSATKRKTFAFQENDIDWINTLILEWSQENEGREKGELITELLQDYRQNKERSTQNQERALRLQDRADRISKPITATLNPIRATLHRAIDKFTEKTDNLQLDDKLDTANTRIDATLTRAGTGIDSTLNRAGTRIDKLAGETTQRLRELRKNPE